MINYLDMRNKGGGRGGVFRIILSLVICFLSFPGQFVHAQDTPTPEPTNTPSPEPTNTPYSIFVPPAEITPGAVCPPGTPFPTPLSIQYHNYCSQCVPENNNYLITPLPFGTLTIGTLLPGGTNTPDPNITPTTTNVPTLTPTITPQIFNIVGSFYDGGGNIPIEVEVSHTTTGFNGGKHWGIVIKNLSGLNGTVKVSGTIKVDVTYSFYPRLTQVKFGYIQHASVGTQLVTRCFMGCTSHDFSDNQSFTEELYFSNNSTPYSGYQTFLFEFDYYPKLNESITFDVYGYGANTSSVTTDYLWTLQNINYFIGIPTPTPSPTPITAYCSEYDYISEDDPSLLDFGGISIRQGSCLKLIPDFEIDLPAVGELIPPINWGIDGFSICPKWVDLGTFEILEIEIPLDILALPAVIFLLVLIFNM